jgi:hypothetical protein
MSNQKGQIAICKILHRKLKIEQHEPHLKPEVNSCAPKILDYVKDDSLAEYLKILDYVKDDSLAEYLKILDYVKDDSLTEYLKILDYVNLVFLYIRLRNHL